MTTSAEGQKLESGWQKIVTVTLLLTAIIVVFLVAFALPNIHSSPKHVPIALVAAEPFATAIPKGLDTLSPGSFTVTLVDSPERARQLILDRSIYGAIVMEKSGLTVLIASAASFPVSAAITGVGEQIGRRVSLPVKIDDIVPFSESDPRGIGLSAGALPIALGGWIAAVGIIATIRGARQRVIAAASFAMLGGFTLTAVLQFWLGTFTGNYWLTALCAALGIAATCFLVLGLQQLLKGVGIGIAAVLLILLGNPLSGLASAPELLPEPWGAVGQLLPPGATGTLLRNVAFFDGAAAINPMVALIFWLLAGLAMYVLAPRPRSISAAMRPERLEYPVHSDTAAGNSPLD